MKLIDILVQELPKLGGWIKGHYQCAQDKNGEVCFYTKGKIHLARYGMWSIPVDSEATHDGESRVVTSLADDYAETIITREQYEAALAASKTEWDGYGLPPVGCECEFNAYDRGWEKCVVLCVSEYTVLLRTDRASDPEEAFIPGDIEFRPIRSEADKKRGSIISKIEKAYKDCPHSDAVPQAIYEAIAEHIRID